jgi:CheY-like chemotaxis protein
MDKLKMLIAEDDISTQALYHKGLTDNVFEKRFASNGTEALEIYESWSPDIIILDIYMPYMTGYSLLMKIRNDFEDNKTTIIMATSAHKKDDIQDCMNLGIQGYILKPFNFKKIEAEILMCCQKGEHRIKHLSEIIRHNM